MGTRVTVDYIKSEIRRLYTLNSDITVSISIPRSRLVLDKVMARIVGVYPNIFRIEESSCGYHRYHSIQYTEVLIGQVRIEELEI